MRIPEQARRFVNGFVGMRVAYHSPMTGEDRWTWLCGEIEAAADAYVSQLDGLTGDEQVPNLDWTVAELTAHLASLPEIYRRQDQLGAAFEAPDDWARFSIEQRGHIALDHLGRLGGLVRSEIDGFVEAVDDPDGERWLYGRTTTHRNIAGAILNELIMHGQDLGRLTGAKPTLTTEQAAAGLPNVMSIVPTFVDPRKAAKLAGTYHFGFRGHGDWTYRIDDEGVLTVEEGRPAKADARVSADPAAFQLVSLGRINQFTPALTGKIIGYGRKPWRLFALGKIAVDGV